MCLTSSIHLSRHEKDVFGCDFWGNINVQNINNLIYSLDSQACEQFIPIYN